MKAFIGITLFLLMGKTVISQTDSIMPLIKNQKLFLLSDSILKQLNTSNKPVILILSRFGISIPTSAIIWKNGNRYCGSYYEDIKGKIKKTSIKQRVIRTILSNRMLSEKCDLCELLSGKNKADIDHDYILYLRRNTSSQCNEIYFTISSVSYYDDAGFCVQDLRFIPF